MRAKFAGNQLTHISGDPDRIGSADLILVFCARNEETRLPFFLEYYRKLGVSWFLAVDNASEDGSLEFLKSQKDVLLWRTQGSYRKARFGMDWVNFLLQKYAKNQWVLSVDPDEFLVFPHQGTRPFRALLDWMDAGSIRSFGAMLLDMYPKGKLSKAIYDKGQNPLDVSPYFDPQNYQSRIEKFYFNLWIQGGPRQRLFFTDRPSFAPALNKIPLVKWSNGNVFRSSTHQMLPRSLNVTYSQTNVPRPCGCLLHFKFLGDAQSKIAEELSRKEHFSGGREYRAYGRRLDYTLWTEYSDPYQDWQQLEKLGLMSRGDWI